MRAIAIALLLAAACSNTGTDPANPADPMDPTADPINPSQREHDARFVALWAVEQNTHALYEVTYYDLKADGTLSALLSYPANCGDHLSEHCVTGSVANCLPAAPSYRCHDDLTCVFGGEWFSLSSSRLVIVGDCSDGQPRDIVIDLAATAGAADTIVTVGGDANWSHDNFDWAFRKCEPGTDPMTCGFLP